MNQQVCDPNRLSSFVRGELSADAERELTAHLDQCESCGKALEHQVAEASAWREAKEFLGDCDFQDQDADSSGRDTIESQIQQVLSQLLPTDHPDSLGRIGGYEVTGVIGSGGMGVVLKARDHSLDRVVAVKVMAPHLAASGSARQRFAREAKAAAAVLHPNVIAIHGVSNEQALPYLVMPYVRGESLQKRIDAEGPLPLIEILRIGAQVAAGLAAAHEQGLVHRDIKPGNILMEQGVERVAITDFGLARAVDDASMTRSGTIAGTPQFMAPEQARGESVDVRSDLFSLGSVMYAMCTGHPPFRADSSFGVMRRITDEEPRPSREINSEIPEWLCGIVRRLMAKRPDKRFASAEEVAELLEECLAHVQHPTTVPLPARIGNLQPETASQPPSRFRRVALAVAGGLLFIVAAIVITLELNKGTLKIETAEVGIPIRIMKGDDLCKEMIVTARNNTVRIAAGQYVVEIVGEHDGLRVESDGVITVTRGETKLVRITQRDRGGSSQQPLGNLPVVGFHLAYFDPAPGLGEYFIPGSDRKIFVELERVAKNADIASARVIDDADRAPAINARAIGVPAIEITFNEESAKRLREVTQRHRGKPLAVFVDGKLLSAPTIREGFAGQAVITGRFTRAEAERIASGLNARSERERDTKNDKTPLWHEFGVTPAPVSPLTAKVLEWIGLHLRPITKERFREKNVFANYAGGLDVTFVRTGGPAEKAGIHEVDIVVRLLGRPMTSLRDLDSAMRDALERIERGDRLSLKFHVLRGGETLQVLVPFPSQSIASKGVQPLQSVQETVPGTADSPDSEQPHELRWDGGITADHAIVRGTQGYTGPNFPGNIPPDRLAAGTYWFLVDFSTVSRIELPAGVATANLRLPRRPNLVGKNLDVKVTLEAKDDTEFIVIEFHNRTAETMRISEADLQLLTAIEGPTAGTRVMSPLWSEIAAGEAIPETKIEPDQTATLRLNWADWVKYGFWFSRGGEVITEPSFPDAEADKTWVRVTPGSALPVSVTHPDKIVASGDGQRIRPVGDKIYIDKPALPRVSDNLQSNLKVRSGLVSGSGIVERIDQDTIHLRSGDQFTVPKQSIVYLPKHGGQPLRIFGADALEPGMAISYSIRDGQPGRIVLMGIVEQVHGGESVFDTIKKRSLRKGSETKSSIDGRHPIRLMGKDGEVEIKIGETKLIELPEPTESIEWRAGEFKPEGIDDIEPFDYVLVQWRTDGGITWSCYASPAKPNPATNKIPVKE